MNRVTARQQSGFTLVEIAIVLVIIGLILGGVLKGQELVSSARVRNIADQQNAIKAAFFAFQDRYRALPGDYPAASSNIPGLSTAVVNGDGDGFIDYSPATPTKPAGNEPYEEVWAYLHMSAAGFIACAQCLNGGNSATPTAPSPSNSLTNAYGGALGIAYDINFGDSAAPPNPSIHIETGSGIPSNILAEVDAKLDDGNPYTGSFQFSIFTQLNGTPPVQGDAPSGCVNYDGTGTKRPTNSVWNRQSPVTNCGAAYLF